MTEWCYNFEERWGIRKLAVTRYWGCEDGTIYGPYEELAIGIGTTYDRNVIHCQRAQLPSAGECHQSIDLLNSKIYDRYRTGMIRRHITCAGRILGKIWLKDQPKSAPMSPVQRAYKGSFYIPWIDESGMVKGGGDNPLLRAGIAMVALAIEHRLARRADSAETIGQLLNYVEDCEVRDMQGAALGFFLRARWQRAQEQGQPASVDEIVGLAMGLHFVSRVSQHDLLAARSREILARISAFFQKSGYLLVPPPEGNYHGSPPKLGRGWFGSFVFEWAFQKIFETNLGGRHKSNFLAHASTLSLAESYFERMSAPAAGVEPGELTRVLNDLLLAKAINATTFYLPSSLRFYVPLRLLVLTAQGGPHIIDALGTNYFNVSMVRHLLLCLLESNDSLNVVEHFAILRSSMRLNRGILRGEGILKSAVDLTLSVGAMFQGGGEFFVAQQREYDLVAVAMMTGIHKYRIDQGWVADALAAASTQMWNDLPLGESETLHGLTGGLSERLIKWHNRGVLGTTAEGRRESFRDALKGNYYCWERHLNDHRKRTMVEGPLSTDGSGSAITPAELEAAAEDGDVCLEGVGLDFIQARALLALWDVAPLDLVSFPASTTLHADHILPRPDANGVWFERASCTHD